jgi:SAM-dependent methyltransferase
LVLFSRCDAREQPGIARGLLGQEDLPMNDYVLRGGAAGAARLRLLARVKWPTTRALLRRAGLRAGMRVLDVGCGAGAVTLALARLIGPAGQAVGIDRDGPCLEIARREAADCRVPAVFHQGEALDLDEPPVYDLVFARFLLTHLREPAAALARLVAAARPGGVVVVEDIECAAHFSAPPCPAFARYVQLYQEVVRRKGADPEIGPRLFGLFHDAGLDPVCVSVVQPAYSRGSGKRLAAVTLEHIREAVTAAGLATDAEIDRLLAELKAFAADPRTLLSPPRFFQLWGRRPEQAQPAANPSGAGPTK